MHTTSTSYIHGSFAIIQHFAVVQTSHLFSRHINLHDMLFSQHVHTCVCPSRLRIGIEKRTISRTLRVVRKTKLCFLLSFRLCFFPLPPFSFLPSSLPALLASILQAFRHVLLAGYWLQLVIVISPIHLSSGRWIARLLDCLLARRLTAFPMLKCLYVLLYWLRVRYDPSPSTLG